MLTQLIRGMLQKSASAISFAMLNACHDAAAQTSYSQSRPICPCALITASPNATTAAAV